MTEKRCARCKTCNDVGVAYPRLTRQTCGAHYVLDAAERWAAFRAVPLAALIGKDMQR